MEKMSFEIYRYNPDVDAKPYMQRYELELEPTDVKLLDALVRLKHKTIHCLSAVLAAKVFAVLTV